MKYKKWFKIASQEGYLVGIQKPLIVIPARLTKRSRKHSLFLDFYAFIRSLHQDCPLPWSSFFNHHFG